MTTQPHHRMRSTAHLTIATSTNPGRLTKLWQLDDGAPKKVSAGQMIEGRVDIAEAAKPRDMIAILKKLQSNQALILGLPPGESHQVVTEEMLPKNDTSKKISRSRKHFQWNAGPGWMMIDHDPRPGDKLLNREQLLEILFAVAPELKNAPMVWGLSGSSEIYNRDNGTQITGTRGQRVYILVADARDIPRAGEALFERLWLAGCGYYLVSKSGQLLNRAPVDSSVWLPERLDFAAPPVCTPPLEVRRPDPIAYNNDAAPINLTTAIPSLSKYEQKRLDDMQVDARKDEGLLAEQAEAKNKWIDARLGTITPAECDTTEAVRQRLNDAVTYHRLFWDFELLCSTGEKVTVGQLLDNPDRWHEKRFHDPLEPEYDDDNRIAWANLNSGGKPYIFSHAHGGVRYTLLRQKAILKLEIGESPRILHEILSRLRMDGEIFERAGILMRLADGELVPVEIPWLMTHLESIYMFLSYDARKNKMVRKDCPEKLAARILAARGEWGVPKVSGVVTFPVMRTDGSVIEQPGFDPATGLIYLNDKLDRRQPEPLDDNALLKTLQRIWQPFDLFPFVDDLSRGVFFAALLTAVIRAALPTAPAFLIRAFSPGTGKTLLSECLMLIAGARPSAMPLPERDPAEIEKRLFAKLRTGCAGLILDNLSGVIDNAAMCAYLTSAEPEGRILGRSETPRVINRALMVLNGNNVTVGGDTFRRILTITLDANCETPEMREFSFNPKNVINERLDEYRTDLLSVLLTFQRKRYKTPGSFGSFEEWERLVRQAVCWLIKECGWIIQPMEDPLDVMKLNKGEDPEHQRHIAVVEAWYELYGGRVVHSDEITKLMGTHDSFEEATEVQINFQKAVRDTSVNGGYDQGKFVGWLRQHKKRVVSGLRIDPGEPGKKVPGWRVTKVREP